MKKIHAIITGAEGYVPEGTLTNFDLEKMVDTTDEWIRTRTGIEKRHIIKQPNFSLSDMGVGAIKPLLEKTNTKPEEIDMIVCATITSDYVMPDAANQIAYKIGAKNAFGFDIRAACSGFLFALPTAAKFIESGHAKKVIVVGGDIMSSIIDYSDRNTCIIFGDGCGAVLLEPSEEPYGIMDHILKGDGIGVESLVIKNGGALHPITADNIHTGDQYVYQDGRTVFKRAVSGMSSVIQEMMAKHNLTSDDVDWIIPHQANLRIITSVASMLDFPMEKVTVNIEKYGNTTSGTLPLCLADFKGQFKKGDTIILSSFGGGFTWGSVLVKWGI